MNWEDSNAATDLKRDFLKAWFSEDQRFFLTGGSALGMFYLDHRRSYDLDLFTTGSFDSQQLRNQLLRLGESIGASCEPLQTSPDFQRFELRRGEERETLDFVIDRVPQLDVTKKDFGIIRVDTLREITALYFSSITLSTVGYGDIVPVSGAVRMLAMMEAMIGTLYMAVLVARLVSLHSWSGAARRE